MAKCLANVIIQWSKVNIKTFARSWLDIPTWRSTFEPATAGAASCSTWP